jgi:hypothetical protein
MTNDTELGKPEDIAGLAVYLFPVDGGYLAV